MKKVIAICLATFISHSLYSQCNPYFNFEVGKKWTYQNYDAKDKSTGRHEISVHSFFETSGGFIARLKSTIYDKKGKELFNSELEYKCEDGIMYVDMNRFVSTEQLQAFGAYEMQMESENLEIPNQLEPGMELGDGSITITASNSPISMTMNVTISNRKVEAEEEIEVPAGTYNAFKFTSDTGTRIKMGMSIERNYKSVQWYAEDVGMIRSESYDDRGRLQGYSVLSSIE